MGKKADRRAARVAAAIDRDATNEALRTLGANLHVAAIAYRRRVDPAWAAERDAERERRQDAMAAFNLMLSHWTDRYR